MASGERAASGSQLQRAAVSTEPQTDVPSQSGTGYLSKSAFTKPSFIAKLPNPMIVSIRTKRLQYELKEMRNHPISHGSAGTKGECLDDWVGTIHGPEQSPYEGGTFFLKIKFPAKYPYKPPHITFMTRIYHCNINSKGDICLDILKDSWLPSVTVSQLLYCISTLLLEPNPNDPLVGQIGLLYKNDRNKHDQVAKQWAEKFAY